MFSKGGRKQHTWATNKPFLCSFYAVPSQIIKINIMAHFETSLPIFTKNKKAESVCFLEKSHKVSTKYSIYLMLIWLQSSENVLQMADGKLKLIRQQLNFKMLRLKMQHKKSLSLLITVVFKLHYYYYYCSYVISSLSFQRGILTALYI